MIENETISIVHDIFTDISSHKLASEIIRSHSSNTTDIRCVALDPLDLSQCRDILDIGCGFGFFTEALQGRVPANAAILGIDVIRGYREAYLESCGRAGLHGSFLAEGLDPVRNLAGGSFDLILCSYALYFFPEIIPEISRILRRGGHFVTITHSSNNMIELIDIVKDILKERAMLRQNRLPIESIMRSFASENGENLLSPWFRSVTRIDYHNTLTFKASDISLLGDYFRFKGAFFLSRTSLNKNDMATLLLARLQSKPVGINGSFTLSKDDSVFICHGPRGES